MNIPLISDNTARELLTAIVVFAVIMVTLKVVQVVILKRLKKVAEKTRNQFDDTAIRIFREIRPPLYFLVSLYFALQTIAVPDWLDKIVTILFVLAMVYEIVQAADKLVEYFVQERIAKSDGEVDENQSRTMVSAVKMLLKVALWAIGLIVALANIGVDVTSLVAGLGIGGIAIALALQNILGDIFSSISIFVDKPFRIGDYIVMGTDSGIVEKIGLKSTRIRTLQGEQLVVSNKELTSVRVQNFKRMERRRAVFVLGLEYGTPLEKLKKVPGLVKDIIDRTDMTEFDRCYFMGYGPSSLDFEVVFYVDSPEYPEFAAVMQEVNLGIYGKFEEAGLSFAFPTQTVHLQK